ncbi:hypothetical protein Aduo_019094 [Ancylostoma duodenale]
MTGLLMLWKHPQSSQFHSCDDCGSSHNGFQEVFPASKTQEILCEFHPGQSIRRELKEKLSKKDALDGKERFREVLNEALPLEFEGAYSAFMTWLASKNEELVSVVVYAHEVMRSCLKKNLHELISEETESLEAKRKEVAEKAGFNCEVARRAAVQSTGRTPKPKPIGAYKAVRIK